MPIISVKNLVKSFGEVEAVRDISFEVEKGEIFAFLGPNGAGKSTTIKMLTTLLQPTSGTLRINGFDPVAEQDGARRSFGIVFQDPSLDDELTARENLEFHAVLYSVPAATRGARIDSLLALVELADRQHEYVKNFSGGMKRRLEIARGLIHHPKVLFLDEPTIGLDPQTRNHMWEYLKRINQEEGMTIFFTTHYMEEAERADARIAIIDHGKIVATGTSESLKAQTATANLEDAFLALTDSAIREEAGDGGSHAMHKMWRGAGRR